MTAAPFSGMTFIGFGEAAAAFAEGLAGVVAYDRKTDLPGHRAGMIDAYARSGVDGRFTNHDAVAGAALILSLVTADQALAAARDTAQSIASGALYYDMNSVAPDTKRAAAVEIEAAGGRYVDVAVMAPVHPARRAVSLLVGGPHAAAAMAALRTIGFATVRVVDGPVGTASSIKMIRSVMVKGLEALSAECALAANAAGVLEAVVASLDASAADTDWRRRIEYNLDRMMVHGTRRAAEMDEVVKTLDALGTGSVMTRGTVARQRAIGALGLAPPHGLDAKLALLASHGPRASAMESLS